MILLGIFTLDVPAETSVLTKLWETPAGLKKPESVIHDPERALLYVSNVNGSPTEKDGNGFIAQVSLQGELVKTRWVTDLNAPKGMAIHDDKLYVADIDGLVEIGLASGKVSARYVADGAIFLNDVTAAVNGDVYVSDMMTDTIYRLHQNNFKAWLTDKRLQAPNGLYAERDHLVVGSWGIIREGFSTKTPGHLTQVSLSDKSIASLGNGKPVGNLDGVEPDRQGNYYVTDWMAGKLFHIKPSGEFDVLLELEQGTADHEYVAETSFADPDDEQR